MKRLFAFFVILTIASAVAFSHTASANDHKVWVCHATSSETNPYVLIHVSENAVYGPGGHFNENGTTQAGHEQDLGPFETQPSEETCPTGPPSGETTTTAPTTTVGPTTTTEVPASSTTTASTTTVSATTSTVATTSPTTSLSPPTTPAPVTTVPSSVTQPSVIPSTTTTPGTSPTTTTVPSQVLPETGSTVNLMIAAASVLVFLGIVLLIARRVQGG